MVLAAILWSTAGILIKLVSLHPIAIAGFRSLIALTVIVILTHKYRIDFSLPQIGGAIAYALTVNFFIVANKLTTATNAILLQYTAPVYAAILASWFLDEPIKWFDWSAILFTIGGTLLFFLDRITVGNLRGNWFAILSGFSYACFVVFMRKQKNDSPIETVILGNLLTGLVGLPFMFETMPDRLSLCGLILLGVVQLGLSYILYSSAIKHLKAVEAVLIGGIEPILNPIWVFLVLGEAPGRWALMGGFIVLTSVTTRCAIAATQNNDR